VSLNEQDRYSKETTRVLSGDFRSRDSTHEFRQKRYLESFLFRLSTTHFMHSMRNCIQRREFRSA